MSKHPFNIEANYIDDPKPMRVIRYEELKSLIDFPGLIESQEQAFVYTAEGKSTPPAYINLPIGKHFAHFKAGYAEGMDYFALKYSNDYYAETLAAGQPIDYAYVILHNAQTGNPEVMFNDRGMITDYRTAAAGAVASKYASREDSRVVGLLGTGYQAKIQLEALTYVRPDITRVKVWGRNEEKINRYIERVTQNLPQIEFVACPNAEDAIRDSDIVVSVTASTSPIVQPDWIEPGTHITAIGACAPYMQEYDPQVLAKADLIYADSIESCLHDGELHHAVDEGVISRESITGELGRLIAGKIPSRTSDDQITFVDLVGIGIQDATAAQYLLSKLDR